MRCVTLALQISFLLGRQLMFGHEPPIQRRSITAVVCPLWAKCQARYFPPSPLPMMTFVYWSVGIVRLLLVAAHRTGDAAWGLVWWQCSAVSILWKFLQCVVDEARRCRHGRHAEEHAGSCMS